MKQFTYGCRLVTGFAVMRDSCGSSKNIFWYPDSAEEEYWEQEGKNMSWIQKGADWDGGCCSLNTWNPCLPYIHFHKSLLICPLSLSTFFWSTQVFVFHPIASTCVHHKNLNHNTGGSRFCSHSTLWLSWWFFTLGIFDIKKSMTVNKKLHEASCIYGNV